MTYVLLLVYPAPPWAPMDVGAGVEKAAGTARGIVNGFSRLWTHGVHHGADEGTRGEILACSGFHVFSVLFEESFVSVSFDVHIERGPRFAVDEIGDKAAEFGGILNLVLCFAEDNAEHSSFPAQRFERFPVVNFQGFGFENNQTFPVIAFRNFVGVFRLKLLALVGHLQEEKIGELLGVTAGGKAIVAEA